MTKSITFLHAADLHLDSPFKGFSDVPEQVFHTMRESTFRAFDQLIQTAIEKEVDFVLLVGDLFDEEKQSLKAQLHLREGFIQLKEHNIDVFISYGNHDYIEGNTYPIEYPDNVHIFTDETVTAIPYVKETQTLAHIHGFSYVTRDVRGNKAQHYTIKDDTVPFNIAMLHGTLHGNHEHDPYAPFRLEDLQREPFDYWALGHIHKRSVVQKKPPIVYPGNIQGRHRKERGRKGCYYVDMNQFETTLEFIPLQQVKIVAKQFDLTAYTSVTQIKKAIINEINKHTADSRLIHLTCISNESQNETLGFQSRFTELVDIINETLLKQQNWQYIHGYDVTIIDQKKLLVDSLFMKEIKEAITTISLEDTIDDLYNHREATKQLRALEKDTIIERAIQYLTEEMSKK